MQASQQSSPWEIQRFDRKDIPDIVTCINKAYAEQMKIFSMPNLRRTSEEKLNDIVNIERVEIWGYRHKQDGIVAVALMRDIGTNIGSIELFSVLSEYMKKGLASSLLRYCEFILTEMKKTKLRMQVVLSDYYDRNSIMKLGYVIESEERWTDQKSKLRPEIFRYYKLITLSKNL